MDRKMKTVKAWAPVNRANGGSLSTFSHRKYAKEYLIEVGANMDLWRIARVEIREVRRAREAT